MIFLIKNNIIYNFIFYISKIVFSKNMELIKNYTKI